MGGLLNWAWQQGRDGLNLYETRDAAADVGTMAHALVEAHVNKAPAPPWPSDFTSEQRVLAEQAFESFLRWERRVGLTIVDQEMSLVSETYRYGGTPDAIAISEDKPVLLDWKSGKTIYMDFMLQMAAYVHLYEEVYPKRMLTGGVIIVRFGKSGPDFSHHEYAANHPILGIAWRQFLRLREAYDDDKELKRLFG
jgi:hypothetical protein